VYEVGKLLKKADLRKNPCQTASISNWSPPVSVGKHYKMARERPNTGREGYSPSLVDEICVE